MCVCVCVCVPAVRSGANIKINLITDMVVGGEGAVGGWGGGGGALRTADR